MATTTYTPRHRAPHPADRTRLSRTQRDALAIIIAGGHHGIPVANLRARTGLDVGRAWAVLMTLRAAELVAIDSEGSRPVAYAIGV